MAYTLYTNLIANIQPNLSCMYIVRAVNPDECVKVVIIAYPNSSLASGYDKTLL